MLYALVDEPIKYALLPLPEDEESVFEYFHETAGGHQGYQLAAVDIKHVPIYGGDTLHVLIDNTDEKYRQYLARCDFCLRTKFRTIYSSNCSFRVVLYEANRYLFIDHTSISKHEASPYYATKIHLLSCVEPFSRRIGLYLVRTQATDEVISAINDIKTKHFRDLKIIRSDRGGAFTSEVFRTACRNLNI